MKTDGTTTKLEKGATNDTPVLELKDVTYRYPNSGSDVLRGVSAGFSAGKLTAIMGRSGAGKSTLLSLISGLGLASAGDVLYRGTSMAALNRDRYRARDAGIIFQAYNLLTNVSALENVMLSMHVSRVRGGRIRERALDYLARVGIDAEKAEHPVLKLSGGEQQRVGIARALSHDPKVVIADEPTGNLDSQTEAQVMDILAGLAHDEGKAVVVVTHANSVASRADEVWGLNRGKMVFVR